MDLIEAKNYYQPLEVGEREFNDLKAAILCSIAEHSSFYIKDGERITFINGTRLNIRVHKTPEDSYLLRDMI